MNAICRQLTLILAGFLAGGSMPIFAQEPVVVNVRTVAGREWHGALSARSNDRDLWLRTEAGGAFLERPIAWEHIAAANVWGLSLTKAELQRLAWERGTPVPAWSSRVVKSTPVAVNTAPVPRSSPTVKSIAAYASLANWDADADDDGLQLQLAAYDALGQTVPLPSNATVQVELWGTVYGNRYSASTGTGRSWQLLESWQTTYRPELNRSQLLFSQLDRFQRSELHPYAELRVRVLIPGSGVFDCRVPGVRIRSYW